MKNEVLRCFVAHRVGRTALLSDISWLLPVLVRSVSVFSCVGLDSSASGDVATTPTG